MQVEPVEGAVRERRETTPLDDDGFESLNGNGSSENGEEAVEDMEDESLAQNHILKDAHNVPGQNRSSLNWRTAPVKDESNFAGASDTQIERSRSALNYNAQKSEESLQSTKLATNSAVPLVQVTQHRDIFNLPDNKELLLETETHSESVNNVCAEKFLNTEKNSGSQCTVLENTGNDSTLHLNESLLNSSCEGSQKTKIVSEDDNLRRSSACDLSAEEQAASYNSYWRSTCRNPSPDANHADSDTDGSDTRGKSPQVRLYIFVVFCLVLKKA